MTQQDKNKFMQLNAERGLTVVKSNELIQKSRYKLGLQEQKIILFCISKIKPTDKGFAEYEFDLRHFCEICGIEICGKNYLNFKTTIKRLSDNSFWIKMPNGDEQLCRWVVKASICKGGTKVKITLDETLLPYLLQLKTNFTQYTLENTLLMKSKYSIRLYEILKSYEYKGKVIFNVEDLKTMLQTAEYKVFNNFKVRVLQPALDEINALTDLNIELETIRENRVITQLKFKINSKNLNENLETMRKRKAKYQA